jgi:replicative DNA helicase
MQIADYIAGCNKMKTYMFSFEMSKNELVLKSIVRENYIKYKGIDVKSVAQIYKECSNNELNKLKEDEHFKWGFNHYFDEINPYIYRSKYSRY